MKRQKIFAFVDMEIKKIYREPAMLFIMILFPIALTLVFGIAFGAIGGGPSTYDIGIVNLDTDTYPKTTEYFIGNLTKTNLFNRPHYYKNEEVAEKKLVQGNLDAVIIIPPDFGESVNSIWENPLNQSAWLNTTIGLKVDSASQFAVSAIPPIIQQTLLVTLFGEIATTISMPIIVESPSLIKANQFTTFDFMAPGLFAYAGVFIIMSVAQSFTTEREEGLLKRIRTTPSTSSEFIISNVISNMILAALQVALVFGMAFIIGYRPYGGIEGISMAFLIMIVFSLCSVGLGLITASIAKSSGTATGLAFIFILPQMFFGSFIPIGTNKVIEMISFLLPSYYATDAITSIFLRGAPLGTPSILIDLLVLSLISVLILIAGTILFKKYGNK